MNATYIQNHIREEVDGARGYLALFKETGDMQVLHMSVDELGHASYFMHKAENIPEDLRVAYDDIRRTLLMELQEQERISNGEEKESGINVQNQFNQPH